MNPGYRRHSTPYSEWWVKSYSAFWRTLCQLARYCHLAGTVIPSSKVHSIFMSIQPLLSSNDKWSNMSTCVNMCDPSTDQTLITPWSGAISETQCCSLLLAYWPFSSDSSQITLGEWYSMFLKPCMTFNSTTVTTLGSWTHLTMTEVAEEGIQALSWISWFLVCEPVSLFSSVLDSLGHHYK